MQADTRKQWPSYKEFLREVVPVGFWPEADYGCWWRAGETPRGPVYRITLIYDPGIAYGISAADGTVDLLATGLTYAAMEDIARQPCRDCSWHPPEPEHRAPCEGEWWHRCGLPGSYHWAKERLSEFLP